MKLYGYWRSSATWRVRIGLGLKGLSYTYQPIHLTKDGGEQNQAAYQAINPMRTVPTLELEEGGQVRRFSQSLAILELLDELHPTPPLLPADPFTRAHARMLAEMVNSGIQPLQNLAVLNRLQTELHADPREWCRYWIGRGLAALQASVRESAGTYCVGDAVTLADVCLVPQLYAARRFGVDLGPYDILLKIEAACEELPAFQAAHADRQPDAVPA